MKSETKPEDIKIKVEPLRQSRVTKWQVVDGGNVVDVAPTKVKAFLVASDYAKAQYGSLKGIAIEVPK